MFIETFLNLFFYLILSIVAFVIVLSITGKSTGIRKTFTILILSIFEVLLKKIKMFLQAFNLKRF